MPDRRMGQVYVKTGKGKTPGEMLRWHKRFLVAAHDVGELQLFKNDQALSPKEVIDIHQILNVEALDRNKAPYLVINIKGGKQATVKVQSAEVRDAWLETINDMTLGCSGSHEKGSNMRLVVEGWKAALSQRLGYEAKFFVDEASFTTAMPPAESQKCLAAIKEGLWFAALLQVSQELASGRHVAHVVNKVVLRKSKPGSTSSFDKVTGGLVLRLTWDANESCIRTPDPAAILRLVTANTWQKGLDASLEHSGDWIDGVQRLRHAVGKDVPIVLDWDDWDGSLQEDTPALRAYVSRWATGDYLDAAAAAISSGLHRDRVVSSASNGESSATPMGPLAELPIWLGGLSLYISVGGVNSGEPPLIRLHRAMLKHDDEAGASGLTRAAVSLYHKCKGSENLMHGLLCEAPVDRLADEIADCVRHISMVALMRQAERITVGTDKAILHFAINWDSFLATLRQLGATSQVRLRLARALLGQYPGRVDSAVRSLGPSEWIALCAIVQKVSVGFVTSSSANKTSIDDQGTLTDICVVARQEKSTSSGQCIVLSFDVKDFGSFCRGLLVMALLDTGSPVNFRKRSFTQMRQPARSESSGNGSCSLASSSDAEDSPHPKLLQDSTPTGPTQYVQDDLSDAQLPQAILAELENSEHNERYPISAALLRSTISALNKTFSDGVIDPGDKLIIIQHAVQKLRHIFFHLDKNNSGAINAPDVSTVVSNFQEYKEPGTDPVPELQMEIAQSDATVSFPRVAAVLLTKLFPNDVKRSLLCKRRCLLLGLESTGKTRLLNLLKQKGEEVTTPTIGQRTEVIGIGGLMLSISEVGGSTDQRKNWSMHSKHLECVHGIIFCIDAAKPNIELSKKYLKDILGSRHLKHVPLLVVVNNIAATDINAITDTMKLNKYCKAGKRAYRVLPLDRSAPSTATSELHSALLWLVNKPESSFADSKRYE
ncbi:Small COPII coat GTPase SAR1 [Diplonema papillatum]|nr:Small COPII coat GTPase SAR1 [Diplonema papillatum]